MRDEIDGHARIARQDRHVEARAAEERVRAAIAMQPVVARADLQAAVGRRRQPVRRVMADNARNTQFRRIQLALRLRRRGGDMERRSVAAADGNGAVRILPHAPVGMPERRVEKRLVSIRVRIAALAEHRIAGDFPLLSVTGERNRLDPRLFQRAQLAGVADTVLVQILPDAELAPLRILRIQHALAAIAGAEK